LLESTGQLYGLEKFWAFLKYYKNSDQLHVDPKLQEYLSKFKSIEDFRVVEVSIIKKMESYLSLIIVFLIIELVSNIYIYIFLQPQIHEILQAARIRNRSVSESAREDTLTSSECLLSDYNTLPNAQESHLPQFRTRAGSFGSKQYHFRRRNDSASSSSQRDLSKQQPRNQRQNSVFSTKPSEANKSQVTARERTQVSSKSEVGKSITIKAEGSSMSQK